MKQNRIRNYARTTSRERCPKCGGKMVGGTCTKCNYSSKTAYRSRREAMEYTCAAD